jgi:putative nucleotidyltransferase with HDIG domain
LEKTLKTGYFTNSCEIEDTVSALIMEILEKRRYIIHLAQIHRHHDDLFAHSINVCILATLTATALGLFEKSMLNTIALGAMFHDIGKVLIPKKILAKQDALTTEETEILKSHTRLGFELLRKNREIPLLCSHIAFQHHERFDGGGYPRRLVGEKIHQLANIVAIANEYDNIVADRPGQNGLEPHIAYEAIVSEVNRAFDPTIAKAFLSRIALYPVGTMVQLISGEIGVVIGAMPRMQHRPIIKVITDKGRNLLTEPFTIDLTNKENLTVFIEQVVTDAEALAFFKKVQSV